MQQSCLICVHVVQTSWDMFLKHVFFDQLVGHLWVLLDNFHSVCCWSLIRNLVCCKGFQLINWIIKARRESMDWCLANGHSTVWPIASCRQCNPPQTRWQRDFWMHCLLWSAKNCLVLGSSKLLCSSSLMVPTFSRNCEHGFYHQLAFSSILDSRWLLHRRVMQWPMANELEFSFGEFTPYHENLLWDTVGEFSELEVEYILSNFIQAVNSPTQL